MFGLYTKSQMKAARREAYSLGCEDTHKQQPPSRQPEIDILMAATISRNRIIADQRAIIAELTIDANKWRAKLERDRKYHAAKRDAAKVPYLLKEVAK